MIEHQDSVEKVKDTGKKISVKQRAMLVGDIIGINGYRANLARLKKRFNEGGYQLHETPHFLVFTRGETPSLIIVHWFAPEFIDADLGYYILQELKPLGFLTQPQNFADIFGAIVESLAPHDVQAWYLYATNTLRRYRHLLADTANFPTHHLPMVAFARLYHRVFDLQVGQRFLDAGCSSGMLPLLVAEHISSLTKVVGVDISERPFPVARRIAEERQLTTVQFRQGDLLSEKFCTIGQFDTVIALHVLEHFTEKEMYQVLAHLLDVTSQRLILIVPYEEGEPEQAYDHKQLFTRAKLESTGRWCLNYIGGGSMHYEDCADGLLVIERATSVLR